jgi:hypothetical protein
MVYAKIVTNGLQLQCAPLINWMCATCTANNPGEAISRAGHPFLRVPFDDSALLEQGHMLVLAKLPGLSFALTTVRASQIESKLSEVVKQLHNVRQDASTRADISTNKTPQDHYRPTLKIWMQLTHAVSKANLPPVQWNI